jgi:hypothetical protein
MWPMQLCEVEHVHTVQHGKVHRLVGQLVQLDQEWRGQFADPVVFRRVHLLRQLV